PKYGYLYLIWLLCLSYLFLHPVAGDFSCDGQLVTVDYTASGWNPVVDISEVPLGQILTNRLDAALVGISLYVISYYVGEGDSLVLELRNETGSQAIAGADWVTNGPTMRTSAVDFIVPNAFTAYSVDFPVTPPLEMNNPETFSFS